MSRSIHTTRRILLREKRFEYADPEKRAERVQSLHQELQQKRWIKEQISEGRQALPVLPTSPEDIPVRILNEGKYIHYPASMDDIRNVMYRLPAGVTDGLVSIDLCLGKEEQEESSDDGPPADLYDPDPFVGRRGDNLWQEIFHGRILGQYSLQRIRLMAYVYDPALPNREMWELYLRLWTLSTFVHEVAHHYDNIARIARGRWLMSDEKKNEIYAERSQYHWVQQYVIPYLEEAYPQQVQTLRAWGSQHVGIPLTLSLLAEDPRATENGALGFFSVHSALDSLVQNLRAYKRRIDTRLWFAEELHWALVYREALDIIDAVLAEHPNHLRALTLQADIYHHQKRNDDARRVAESVIAMDATYRKAWIVLADAYESLEDWNLLLTTASHAMTLYEADFTYWTNMLEARARAHLHLGQFDEFEADIALYPRPESTFAQRRVAKLRQEMATVKAVMGDAHPTQ